MRLYDRSDEGFRSSDRARPAGFGRVQISARVFTPGLSRCTSLHALNGALARLSRMAMRLYRWSRCFVPSTRLLTLHGQDDSEGAEHDAEVEAEGAVLDVIEVVLDLGAGVAE